jgi:hypothetical protein
VRYARSVSLIMPEKNPKHVGTHNVNKQSKVQRKPRECAVGASPISIRISSHYLLINSHELNDVSHTQTSAHQRKECVTCTRRNKHRQSQQVAAPAPLSYGKRTGATFPGDEAKRRCQLMRNLRLHGATPTLPSRNYICHNFNSQMLRSVFK